MKNLYYKFSLLLMKPIWYLTTSILLIILIRIFLFKELFAEEYHILKGEKNIHPFIENNGNIVFIGNHNQNTISPLIINTLLEHEKNINILIAIDSLTYQPNKCSPDIRKAYMYIMNIFDEIFEQSTTEDELARNCMKKIRDIMPYHVWPTLKSDFYDPSHKCNKLFDNILVISNMSLRSKDCIAENLLLNAFIVYKKALVYKLSNNDIFLEQMFLRHLESEKYGYLKNPFFKNIATDE